MAPRFVDTGTLRMQSAHLVGPEFAWVYGPASVQTEYVRAGLNPVQGNPNSNFHGYYLLGSYFLTGEQRNYRASEGQFRGIKPKRNFNIRQKGTGAWEVAVRYSSLDLNHGPVSGGRLNDFTAGLNWYLNPNARVMWIRANRTPLAMPRFSDASSQLLARLCLRPQAMNGSFAMAWATWSSSIHDTKRAASSD